MGLCLIGLFKVPIIRDLAEETVDGSAFDDFSASAIFGRQVGVMSNWFVQLIRDLAEETVDGSAFDGFFYVGNNRETGWGYV